MTMPGDITFSSNTTYFGANLTEYVRNGTIPESRVDDMGRRSMSPPPMFICPPNFLSNVATRILAAWYLLGQDSPSYPSTNFNAFLPQDAATNEHIDVMGDHYKLVREIGAASTVLLKNERGALPLKEPRSLALIGSDAGPGRAGPNQFPDQVACRHSMQELLTSLIM